MQVFSCIIIEFPEVVVRSCSSKQVSLKILQNSQKNTCARVFFNKIAGLMPQMPAFY